MNDVVFDQIDFGELKKYLDDPDVTDISYSNGGQLWLKTLSKGIYRVEEPNINNAFMEKLAFQCSNVMGKTFNMASPFLDAESAELRLNFVHDSIARNGIAVVLRKTPAKVRLEKDKIIADKTISNIKEVKARGAYNVIITNQKIPNDLADEVIYIDNKKEYVGILVIICLQLLAYYSALELGRDIDMPRNLAKSVTVE